MHKLASEMLSHRPGVHDDRLVGNGGPQPGRSGERADPRVGRVLQHRRLGQHPAKDRGVWRVSVDLDDLRVRASGVREPTLTEPSRYR